MLDELKKQSFLIKTFFVLASVAIGIYVFQILWGVLGFFSDIIIILFSAWVLSFILGPAVQFLEKKARLPKLAAAAIVYLLY